MLGLQRIKNLAADILIVSLVSWIMGNVFIGIIFEIIYIPLRIYAGGFHVSSQKLCKYISFASVWVCLLTIFFVPFDNFVMSLVQMISWVIIFLLSPVESKNHLLNCTEKKIFRRRSIAIASIESIAYLGLMAIGAVLKAKTICVAMVLVGVGMVLKQN